VAKRAIVGWFYRDVDGALFVGDNNKAYHKSFGIPDDRLFPGSLPIDLQWLRYQLKGPGPSRIEVRERFGIGQDDFLLLFCGKLVSRKRPLDLIAALKQASRSPKTIHAVFVGEGSERNAIEKCRTGDLARVVHLAGFANQSEIPKFYAACDVLVVTSSFDPHPLVVTEAAAFGRPAIVSDAIGCIGPNDTARPDENALVYKCGEVHQLAECILKLCANTALRAKMSAAAEAMANTQDVSVAADQLAHAATRLKELGPRT
jgi:glycosyltransferase involved in cell wall biosynthesis